MTTTTLFERLKAEQGITAVVENFYDRVLADPTLAPVFAGVDTAVLRRHQALFMIQAAGGPAWNNQTRTLREAHAGRRITDEHFGAVAGHLSAALDWAGVDPEDKATVLGLVGSLKDEVVGH